MEAEIYSLYRGPDLLGTVVQRDALGDCPWYGGQFAAAPAPAFASVEHLFKEELLLLDADEMDTWEEVWAQIEEPGLQLRPANGGEAISELIIHIEGGGGEMAVLARPPVPNPSINRTCPGEPGHASYLKL